MYELGRAIYKWAAVFAIVWSFVSVVLVSVAGKYVESWIPTTPFTTLAIISQASDIGNALRNAALSALSFALSVGALMSFGYISGQYYLSLSFRSVSTLFDIAVLSSVTQIIMSSAYVVASVLGPVSATVIAGFGALITSALAVYMAYYIAGVPPPQ